MFLITHNSISISAQRQYSSPKLPGHMMQSQKLLSTFIAFAPFLLRQSFSWSVGQSNNRQDLAFSFLHSCF